MVFAWLGLMLVLYVTSFLVEVEISSNALVDQVVKLLIFGILVTIWLWIWYMTTQVYRSRALKRLRSMY